MAKIKTIIAKEIQDSRGQPTIEATIETDSGHRGVASVPSGKSTGKFEAATVEINQAIKNVNDIISPKLVGMNIAAQEEIDKAMIELDGTENKAKLGANAILGVSLAAARAAANSQNVPLYRYLGLLRSLNPQYNIPSPMFNLINGGQHAANGLNFQEFMVIPTAFSSFAEKLEAGFRIFEQLEEILKTKGLSVNFGDEGGFAPRLPGQEKEALGLLVEAVKAAGFQPGNNVFLGIDVAASALAPEVKVTLDIYHNLVDQYPILSLEDPFGQEEWHQWAQFKIELEKRGKDIILIGDDLFATNPARLQKGVTSYIANAILIKLNQIGTLTETLQVIDLAKRNQYTCVISHRSGETNDNFVADLAVATGAGFIKSGASNKAKPERMAKYERLAAIEKELNE